jgi:hypothetical protein
LVVDRIEQEIRDILAKLGASLHDDLTEYHKGEWCPMQGIFCQEGHCSGCDIARRQNDRLKN